MPGRFEIVARRRPVDLVAPAFAIVTEEGTGIVGAPAARAVRRGGRQSSQRPRRSAALARAAARPGLRLRTACWTCSRGGWADHPPPQPALRPARHGRPDGLALTLTGTQLTGLTRERGRWVARARYDLEERVDTRLTTRSAPACELRAEGEVARRPRRRRSGSSACATSGSSPRPTAPPSATASELLLTATHAGPGFFDAAHTGVWSLDPGALGAPAPRGPVLPAARAAGRVRRPRHAPGPRRRTAGWSRRAPGATSTGPGATPTSRSPWPRPTPTC